VISLVDREVDDSRAAYGMGTRMFFFNPQQDFQLHANDIIMVFGHELSIVHFKDSQERGTLPLKEWQ
jgi:voltage-gated potassium channel